MTWTHTDREGLSPFIAESLDRAAEGGAPWWPEDIDAVRGVQLARALEIAALSGETEVQAPTEARPLAVVTVVPHVRGDDERGRAAETLLRTAWLLGDGGRSNKALRTDSSVEPEAGAAPILGAVAVVAGAVVATVVITHVADQAAEIIDRKLARDADYQKLVELDATALKVVKHHTEREQTAGKTLPLDDASKAALNNLGKAQEAIAKKERKPLPTFVDKVTGGGNSDGLFDSPIVGLAALVAVMVGIAVITK